eukprot:scaffold295307_cov28-Prasinocladus_malaysianus.AAC.1
MAVVTIASCYWEAVFTLRFGGAPYLTSCHSADVLLCLGSYLLVPRTPSDWRQGSTRFACSDLIAVCIPLESPVLVCAVPM